MYLYLGSMYEIEKFENGPLSIEVRTLYIEGVVWFVLTDLARALGYRDASAARHLLRSSQYVQADEAIKQALGIRGRAPYLVNESGFYRLAIQSSKAEAEPFQLWVEDEVLPTIRKARSVGIDALEEMKGRIQQRTAELESKIKGADNYRRQLEKEIPAVEARYREEMENLYVANKAMHLIEDDLHEILIDMEKQGAKLPRKPMTHAEARKRARES
jgi:prophage antirepressor-like protein